MAKKPSNFQTVVKQTIAELFERSRARLLGTQIQKPNRLVLQVIKDFGVENSIEGLFRAAQASGVSIDTEVDESLIKDQSAEAGMYVDELEKRTALDVVKAIKNNDPEAIKKAFQTATSHLETIVTTETMRAQNLAIYDGILQAAISSGVSDPILGARGRVDSKVCRFCLKMYHVESNINKPRAFKASQIVEGWFKPKEWNGMDVYRCPLHVRCRHIMFTILPGYGLDESGSVKYMGEGYNEYDEQKSKGETW